MLDGGLRTWQAEGRELSTDVPGLEPATFRPRTRPEWKASKEEVLAAIGQPGTIIVEAAEAFLLIALGIATACSGGGYH